MEFCVDEYRFFPSHPALAALMYAGAARVPKYPGHPSDSMPSERVRKGVPADWKMVGYCLRQCKGTLFDTHNGKSYWSSLYGEIYTLLNGKLRSVTMYDYEGTGDWWIQVRSTPTGQTTVLQLPAVVASAYCENYALNCIQDAMRTYIKPGCDKFESAHDLIVKCPATPMEKHELRYARLYFL